MNKWARSGLGVALIAFALLALPFVLLEAGQAWLRIVNLAILYIFLALGLNIVVGFAGLLDLGYIAFYAVGAYIYAFLASPQFGIHWPFWAVLPIGAMVACFFGVLLGAPTLRLRGDYLAIVTLGFGEIVRIFLNNLGSPINITNGPQGISQIDPVNFFGLNFAKPIDFIGIHLNGLQQYYYLLVLLMLGIILVNFRLHDSRLGRAWQAIREDEMAAKALGINARNIKLLAFAIGASFGGVAGGVFAAMQGFVSPESFSLIESIMVLSMVVLGGMGHIPGVILGAVLLAVLPEVLRYSIVPLQQAIFSKVLVDPESVRMLIFGLALVLMMRWRPVGLWPPAQHKPPFEKTRG